MLPIGDMFSRIFFEDAYRKIGQNALDVVQVVKNKPLRCLRGLFV